MRERSRLGRTIAATALAALAWVLIDAAAAVAQIRGNTADPSTFFANPPLKYDGGEPHEGVLPLGRPGLRGGYAPAPTFPAPTPYDAPPAPRGYQAAPVAARDTEIPVRLPQDDSSDGFPYVAPDLAEDEFLVGGPKLSAYKNGFFQKLSFGETYLPRWDADGLGINEVETFVTVAVPMPKREWPMLITPYFQWRAIDGPTGVDVPPNLYETYVDFMWVPRVSPRWTGIVAVAPSFYSDFESREQNGFRFTGKGFIRYDAVPEKLQVIGGILYLNRHDIKILPAGGLIWDPNPDTHFEVLFPRPKFSRRVSYGRDWEHWIYLAGEFGGNSFDITHPDGSPDTCILYDNRISIGWEHKRNGGAGARLEMGVVFNRRVELTVSDVEVHPGTTAMVRGVITF